MIESMLHVTLLSVKVAFMAVLICTPFAIGFGYYLSRSSFRGKLFVENLLMLPLIIPPVTVGLILMFLLSPNWGPGMFLSQTFGIEFLLDWKGAALASAVVAFPLFYRSCEQAFSENTLELEQVGGILGLSRWQCFQRISFPLARYGVAQGAVMGFARAVSEFGATSLVAGMIPGETDTLALSIYSSVINGDDATAWSLTGISILLALGASAFATRLKSLKGAR